MAITSSGTLGVKGQKAAGTSWTTAASGVAASVGDEVILQLSADNLTGTDGDNSEHLTVTDSAGNTYTKLVEFTNGSAAANAGITISLWRCKLTNAIVSGTTTWTIDYNGTVVAKLQGAWKFAVGAGMTLQLADSDVLATEAGGAGSMTLSGLENIEHLFWRLIGFESNSTTALTPTSGWTVGNSNQTTAGAVESNVGLRNEWIISTGTSATSNPASGGGGTVDQASILVALKEVSEAPPQGSASGSFAFAGVALGASVHRGSASGTDTWAGSATGAVVHQGTAAGTLAWAGSTTGSSVHKGSGAGSHAWSGTSSGATDTQGLAAGGWGLAGTATGEAPALVGASGSIAGAWALTGSATGARTSLGSATGSSSWEGSAAGARASSGSLVGACQWDGSALGAHTPAGEATGVHQWTGQALGPISWSPVPRRSTTATPRRSTTTTPRRSTAATSRRD